MKTLLYYLLQMIVASGILYAYYHFALRNKRFHHYNRFYLLAATIISIVIPFLNIPVYFTQEETDSSFVLQTLTAISPGTIDSVTATHSSNFFLSTKNIIYLVYAIIGGFVLLRIMISLLNIRRIAKNNPSEKIDNIRFIKTSEPSAPFSFFRWLFWNTKIELQSEKGEQIFKHEYFHIQQQHSWDIIYLEILSVLFWINPFFYLIKKEVKAIHEFLADQFAINENKKWEYAELLLMQVLNTNHHLVNPFFHNQIKRRIAMITTSNKPRHQYLRKMMVLPLATIIIFLFAFSYKNKNETGTMQESLIQQDNKNSPDTSGIIINGTINPNKTGENNPPSSIFINGKEIKVKKLIIDGMDTLITDSISFHATAKGMSDTEKPLIVLNGVIQKNYDLSKLGPNEIVSVRVLKDKNATDKYGDAGMNGVIEITTVGKLAAPLTGIADTSKPVGKIWEKVETEPSFPGGAEKWKEYINRNIQASVPVDKGAPGGNYTVVVQFIVSKEGVVSDVKALTKHGYGMEEEAIRVINKGPYWVPAMMNRKQVSAYRKQPITFVITEETEPVEKTNSLRVEKVSKTEQELK